MNYSTLYVQLREAYFRHINSADNKAMLHRESKKQLRKLAKLMGLPKGTFSVRSNEGGPAVLGEAILHTEFVYVMITEGTLTMPVMYRTCDGLKDYTGGRNQWCSVNMLDDVNLQNFADLLNSMKRVQ